MKKVIIWGHKLYQHTHSHIHNGFYRNFQYLGYDTYWFDNKDDVSNFDFSDCLFLTEGQTIEKMPIRKDCSYLCHNVPQIEGMGKRVNFQYYSKECFDMEHISHGIAISGDCVFFPWGSPLLPEEFDLDNVTRERGNNVYHIGTVDAPRFPGGNFEPLNDFAKACVENGHPVYFGGGYSGNIGNQYLTYIKGWVSEEDHVKYLLDAYYAPALQGDRQLVDMMITCRLFKNLSYGNDGVTNNPFAQKFFYDSLVFNDDCYQLFFDAEFKRDEIARKKWLMNFVKENHTYVQNIKAMISIL